VNQYLIEYEAVDAHGFLVHDQWREAADCAENARRLLVEKCLAAGGTVVRIVRVRLEPTGRGPG